MSPLPVIKGWFSSSLGNCILRISLSLSGFGMTLPLISGIKYMDKNRIYKELIEDTI
jgi:hypothetical protein